LDAKETVGEEQIIAILREVEKGEKPIGDVCRAHGIAENTFYPRAKSMAACKFPKCAGYETWSRRTRASNAYLPSAAWKSMR
jgi:hypothetical protein